MEAASMLSRDNPIANTFLEKAIAKKTAERRTQEELERKRSERIALWKSFDSIVRAGVLKAFHDMLPVAHGLDAAYQLTKYPETLSRPGISSPHDNPLHPICGLTDGAPPVFFGISENPTPFGRSWDMFFPWPKTGANVLAVAVDSILPAWIVYRDRSGTPLLDAVILLARVGSDGKPALYGGPVGNLGPPPSIQPSSSGPREIGDDPESVRAYVSEAIGRNTFGL
jgi:hypothetical protein